MPTLVIAGADDPSTPVEPHSRTLAEGIPGARLEVLPGAHLATIESAEHRHFIDLGERRRSQVRNDPGLKSDVTGNTLFK